VLGRNEEAAALLENISELLALKHESIFRVRAYKEAGRTISAMVGDIDDLHRRSRLQEIPRVGRGIARTLTEYLETGRSTYYERLMRELSGPPKSTDGNRVRAAGPKRSQTGNARAA